MAKISARGAYEVARATRDRTLEETGALMRDFLVLRSDGKVLGKANFRNAGSTHWSQGSYGIRGSLSPKDGRTSEERFVRYAKARGYEVCSTYGAR